ncbi:hypothetical protein F0562_027965 [Nyssa sinensis]|uniref:Uncharacterized protein n=1 Tax=Nyssa sinensis TaxID=561372 RepID=A0A5J5B8H2_9ASTE|nr:hypothetical protein F0562_027965 [Nyssa sinensis]
MVVAITVDHNAGHHCSADHHLGICCVAICNHQHHSHVSPQPGILTLCRLSCCWLFHLEAGAPRDLFHCDIKGKQSMVDPAGTALMDLITSDSSSTSGPLYPRPRPRHLRQHCHLQRFWANWCKAYEFWMCFLHHLLLGFWSPELHLAKSPFTGFSIGGRDSCSETLSLSSEPQRRGSNQDSGPMAPAGKKPDSSTASHIYRAFSNIFTKMGSIKLLGFLFPADLFFLRFFLKIWGIALDMTLDNLIKNN